jgi:large subunit ribosomal protein L23Ae
VFQECTYSLGDTKTAKPESKADAAKKAALQGSKTVSKKKIRTHAIFRRPKTLELRRAPKYVRKAVPSTNKLDHFAIIKNPMNTESAMKKVEDDNTLVFLVDVRANKYQIRDAVKKMYGIDCVKINTLIRPDGLKKAFVRLPSDNDATEIASKIGFI